MWGAALGLVVCLLVVVLLFLIPRTLAPPPPGSPDETAPVDAHAPPPGSDRAGAIVTGAVSRAGAGVPADLVLRLHVETDGETRVLAWTDREGAFRIEGTAPGDHEISATDAHGVRIARRFRLWSGIGEMRVDLLFPAGGVGLRGRAVHEDGRPFRGEVGCTPAGASGRVDVPTGADGRFEISGLAPGEVTLWCRVEGELQVRGPEVVVPRESEVVFVVDAGVREMGGTVIDAATGEPIPGAVVNVFNWLVDDEWADVSATTGEDGRYCIRVPLDGEAVDWLSARADGYLLWQAEDVPWRDRLTFRLERSARVSARVVSAGSGRPVPGVPVELSFDLIDGSSEEESAITGDDGRAVFSVVPARPLRLSVNGNGWIGDPAGPPAGLFPLTPTPGEEVEVELRAVRSARVEVRVVSSEGALLPGASLSFRMPGRFGSTTLNDGTTVLDGLRAGAYTLTAYYFGLSSAEHAGTTMPGDVHRVELHTSPGQWITARVTDEATGEPVPEASVRVGKSMAVATDADGLARVGPFAEGSRLLAAEHPEYRPAMRRTEPIRPRVEVRLRRALEITGRVTLPDGTPVEKGEVGWYGTIRTPAGSTARWYDDRRSVRVDAEGRFRLTGLPAGDLEINARRWHPSRGTWNQVFFLPAGSRDVEIVLQVPDVAPEGDPPRLELFLTDPSGAPVPCAEFELHTEDEKGEALRPYVGRFFEGEAGIELCGDETAFRIDIQSARTHTGRALPLGSARLGPFPARPGRIELHLPPEHVITGAVRDPSGRGLAKVAVEAELERKNVDGPMTSPVWLVWTDGAGEFRIGGLGAGRAEIKVDAPEGYLQTGPVWAPTGTDGVVVTLDRVVQANVTVLDGTDRPVPRAYVGAEPELDPDATWQPPRSTARTDEAGVALLTDLLGSGRYTLTVYSGPGRRDLAPVRIEAFVPGDRVVRLPRGFNVNGQVLGPDGEPVPEGKVRVWARCEIGDWWANRTDAGGCFKLTGLPEGGVWLTVRSAGCLPHEEPSYCDPKDLPEAVRVSAGTEGVLLHFPPRK